MDIYPRRHILSKTRVSQMRPPVNARLADPVRACRTQYNANISDLAV